jgi:CheY-like chemotaxis protein
LSYNVIVLFPFKSAVTGGIILNDSEKSIDDGLDWLAEDEEEKHEFSEIDHNSWVILVVDDDEGVHQATDMAIQGFCFEGTPLDIIHAYSGQECQSIIEQRDDIALILLDVVMESEDAGLNAVKYIRSELSNNTTRIILRTGQPGIAPEQSVIRDYDIDGYSNKTKMTQQNLEGALYTSLRAYRDIHRSQTLKKTLDQIIEATNNISILQGLSSFSHTLLEQFKVILSTDSVSIFAISNDIQVIENENLSTKALKVDEHCVQFFDNHNTQALNKSQKKVFDASLQRKDSFKLDNYIVQFLKGHNDSYCMLAVEIKNDFSDEQLGLIKLFLSNALLAYEKILQQSIASTTSITSTI